MVPHAFYTLDPTAKNRGEAAGFFKMRGTAEAHIRKIYDHAAFLVKFDEASKSWLALELFGEVVVENLSWLHDDWFRS